jgi:hypothetical protein
MAFKMKGMAIDKSPMPMKGHANTTAMYKNGEDDKKNDRQPPRQPGENPDLEVYEGDNLVERINDLEDRIEFLQSDISEEVGPTEKKATMTQNLKLLQAKLKDLKSRRK